MKTLLLTIIAIALGNLPAQAFDLVPYSTIGDSRSYADSPDYYISSGYGSKSIKSLNTWLGLNVSAYGNYGSGAKFHVDPGIYSLSWIMTSHRDEASDQLIMWDGNSINQIAYSWETEFEKPYQSALDLDRWTTSTKQTTFTTHSGDFALMALDGLRRWNTTWKIEGLEKIGELANCQTVPEPSGLLGIGLGLVGILSKRSRKISKR